MRRNSITLIILRNLVIINGFGLSTLLTFMKQTITHYSQQVNMRTHIYWILGNLICSLLEVKILA